MDAREQEARLRAERARRIALFCYELIQDVIDPALSTRPSGQKTLVAVHVPRWLAPTAVRRRSGQLRPHVAVGRVRRAMAGRSRRR